MNVILLHIILSIILFFIVNWIGKHSFSVGYMQISMFQKVEEAPAFNYIYRILSPTVYIIILSVIFYKFSLDDFVFKIYFISIYYIVFRLLFNLITNRGRLINWIRQIITDIAIILLSYLSYNSIIINRENLIPDFSTFSEELWIIIAIFIYQVFNKVNLSSNSTIKRKNKYIKNRILKFKKEYDTIIREKVNNERIIALIYSIIIYEDFNRPKVIRLLENIVHKITNKPHTLGVMQVYSKKIVSDIESVKLGTDKIINCYNRLPVIFQKIKEEREIENDELLDNIGIDIKKFNQNRKISQWEIERELLKDYNPDNNYIHEVSELVDIVCGILNCKEVKYTFDEKTKK